MQCQVIAPPPVPRKPGERIKTNRRDARKLAELHRAGLLTAVRAPTPAEEAVRDLCRARNDARADRQRCRHRLGKLLLRRGLHYPGRAWTMGHRRWVNQLMWPHAADRVVVEDYVLAIDQVDARLGELGAELAAVATSEPYREPVGWLRCFRGIDTLTAMLLAELHGCASVSDGSGVDGISRTGARGALERRPPSSGPITKTGNTLGTAPGCGSGMALSASARCRSDAGPTAERPAAAGRGACGQGAEAVVSAFSTACRLQAGPGGDGGRSRRTRRLRVGGLAPGGRVTGTRIRASRRRDVAERHHRTTVAGVASSRADAAPSRVPSMTDSLKVKVLYPARWRRRISEAQGRRREAGSEGSAEQSCDPMNKNPDTRPTRPDERA